MNDYTRGAWEALNYAIRVLMQNERKKALQMLIELKDELEMGVAVDFAERLRMLRR